MSAVTQGEGKPGSVFTVILDVAVLAPSCVVTVIVALPAATPVTRPLLFTVAMAALLVDQDTVLLVALEGETVAVNCCVPPAITVADVGDTATPVTGTFTVVTVKELVAVLFPS